MKKGSTAWYQEMNLQLLRHVNGMGDIRRHQKLKRAISIMEIAVDFARASKADVKECEKIQGEINRIAKSHLNYLQLRIKKYLS